jgi:hypothetical protein
MLWTWWLGASSGILLAMSSQACVEKKRGFRWGAGFHMSLIL